MAAEMSYSKILWALRMSKSMILSEHALKGNEKQGSQICQISRILRQNSSDDSKEVTEGVTSTPEISVTNREPLRL